MGSDVGRPAVAGTSEQEAASQGRYARAGYRWYVLILMLLVYACHALDRAVPNIIVEPVRHEFGLSDSQLGLLSGVAFGLAFSVFALPIGILSDRMERRKLLAIAVFVWSFCTVLGGLARNYGQLLLSRIGVGAAEAGAAPVIMPMLSDVFPTSRRGLVLGALYFAVGIGTFLASVIGGYLAEDYGWRAAFLVVGAPGILLAILVHFTVEEPRRGAQEGHLTADGPPPKIREVAAYVIRTPAILCIMMGCALIGLISITTMAWVGSLFIRVHGLGLKEVGLLFGSIHGLMALVSPMLYGFAADKLALRDPRWPLRLVWVSCLLALAASMGMVFTSSVVLAIVCFGLADFLRIGYPPPCFSVLLNNTPVRMRGTVMSLLQLVTNLVGFGVGPLLAGALSDLYGGDTAIRYGMATVFLLFLVVAPILMTASWLLYGRRVKAGAAA